ncbi:tripartite tricarboxylate transporter substrate binding protein [Acidovorax sp. Be4]|uniref:Tripartite tricarboxylate transporter substrate binding protein n=1 Tax=Acidovorax bellezanensis TaxID=2976702 RepID=A0ABT2PL63_9BURK|nr:tripartite tricarboxylate transporter substrate binding protein [Acidovorax sp. Be4]MCT9810948.1 tripartite tricarboxylate transporter substrate binding protein [Acidovorax sp. Be4]
MIKTRRFLLAALAALSTQAAFAAYPDKPVRIIVPFPAGGAADNAMRVVALKLSDYWSKPVIIDNRPGVPGLQAAALAAPDGYTLLLGAGSSIVTHPLINSKLPFNPTRDFAPIGRVVANVPVLVVHPSLGIKSVKELVALAKKNPGELNFSSSGHGSPNHLAMELFMAMSDTKMVHVPYKGGAPSVNELAGGHVQMGINAVPSVMPYIKAGKLTPLAVASARRDRSLPDVPTVAESGVPGFEYEIWYALFAPSRTPANIIAKTSTDLQRALADPEVVRKLIEQGAEPRPSSAQELAQYIKDDTARWTKVIKERNLKID